MDTPKREATSAIRGSFLHFVADPFTGSERESYRYLEDGLLWIEEGRIKAFGEARSLKRRLPTSVPLTTYTDSLIVPGFVDLHVHYPQIGMIASFGAELLDWLDRYTFPMEERFSDKRYAARVAKFFIDELLRNGTTTAMVFATVFPGSVEALFEEAERSRMRLITGKVLMDRNAPRALLDTPESAYRDSRRLIRTWHGRGRLHYAVTPRFAITSSPEELAIAGRLIKENPGVYLQTHLSENRKEVKRVKALFPKNKSYLDVYDQNGLLGPRSIFAHSIYLSAREIQRLSRTQSSVAFCPSSNLFLGSGLFPLSKMRRAVRVGLGTDIGAGTSLSLLHTLNEAYKVARLQGDSLSPVAAFYLATRGGASALSLNDRIGSFTEGFEADLVVLNLKATRLLAHRIQNAKTLDDKLFALMMLGDDRTVKATYLMGKPYAAN